jgi:hypothetical protein
MIKTHKNTQTKQTLGLTAQEYKIKSAHEPMIVENDLKGCAPHYRSRTVRSIEEAVRKNHLEIELNRWFLAYLDWKDGLPRSLSSCLKNLEYGTVKSFGDYGEETLLMQERIARNKRIFRIWQWVCEKKKLDVNNFIWLVATPVTAQELYKRQGKTRLYVFKNLISCLETFKDVMKYRLYEKKKEEIPAPLLS